MKDAIFDDEREVTLRTVPQPSDLNVNGNIFGGWVLSQMDIAGATRASRRAGGPVATVAVNSMKFHEPINVGEIVSVYTDIEKVGNTSIAVKIDVYADSAIASSLDAKGERGRRRVTEGQFIFVAVDEEGKPKPVAQNS